MNACRCRCHTVGPGAHTSCDVGPEQPGGLRSCIVTHDDSGAVTDLCDACGEPLGAPHKLREGDCVLAHADPHVEAKQGRLCSRHFGWILDTLREIEQLWALRGHVLLPGPAGDTRHGTRDGSPAPGNVTVMALSDRRNPAPLQPGDVPDVPGTLLSWYRLVAEELPIRDMPERITVVGLLHALHRERRWIARQPWVDDYANELHDLHRALAGATGAGLWAEACGTCPNCQSRLYPTIGIDEITCRRCKTSWAGVHLARLRLVFEKENARDSR